METNQRVTIGILGTLHLHSFIIVSTTSLSHYHTRTPPRFERRDGFELRLHSAGQLVRREDTELRQLMHDGSSAPCLRVSVVPFSVATAVVLCRLPLTCKNRCDQAQPERNRTVFMLGNDLRWFPVFHISNRQDKDANVMAHAGVTIAAAAAECPSLDGLRDFTTG